MPGVFRRLIINMHGNKSSEVLLKTNMAIRISNQHPISVATVFQQYLTLNPG